MPKVLVVGATGQVGSGAVREMVRLGRDVRAMVRSPQAAERMRALGADPVMADLTGSGSLRAACRDVECVVATANAAIPSRPGDTFRGVDQDGYRSLIEAALENGVSRFVYVSVPDGPGYRNTPFLRAKRQTENLLVNSRMQVTILRAGIFMEVAFAMLGSDLPLRGAEEPTVLRPFGFSRRHFEGIRRNIAEKRLAAVPGDGTVPQAFICSADLARLLAVAAENGPSGVFDLNGPEALTFLDVVGLYERILGVKIRVRTSPRFVFRALATLLGPFQPAAANLMYLNYLAATVPSQPVPETPAAFGIRLTTAAEFLESRASR